MISKLIECLIGCSIVFIICNCLWKKIRKKSWQWSIKTTMLQILAMSSFLFLVMFKEAISCQIYLLLLIFLNFLWELTHSNQKNLKKAAMKTMAQTGAIFFFLIVCNIFGIKLV